ncbi:MAG: TonB family protein [Bryobacterales bacterium]|nr:TonB family protein [Bryobacterales bacterium]
MRFFSLATCSLVVFALPLQGAAADSNPHPTDAMRLGPGVTAPQILKKVEPEFTSEAREALVQGTVLLVAVINVSGRAQNIEIVSPIGFGLDERAITALEQWLFRPAMYRGKAVASLASIEVNFRLQSTPFNSEKEQQRQRYNVAVKRLNGSPKEAQEGARQLEALAKEKLPAAAYAYAYLLEEGRFFPRNLEAAQGFHVVAADAGHGEAISRLALAVLEQGAPGDEQAAIEKLRVASLLGSRMAQRWLGTHHLTGEGLPRDKQRAERHLHRCAAQDDPHCQFFLGRSMLNGSLSREDSGLTERRYLQALAWLSLAEAGGLQSAAVLARPHREALGTKQLEWIQRLAGQLIQKEHWVPAMAN